MSFLVRSARTGAAALGAAVVGAVVFLGTAATAVADDPRPPNCTSADLAGVMSGVQAGTAAYLFTHPDFNAFLTSLKDLPAAQRREQLASYLDANPQVRAELKAVRQAKADFRARCG